jgi:hypothetical protein
MSKISKTRPINTILQIYAMMDIASDLASSVVGHVTGKMGSESKAYNMAGGSARMIISHHT